MSLWNLLHEISFLSLSHTPASSTYITPPHKHESHPRIPPPHPPTILFSTHAATGLTWNQGLQYIFISLAVCNIKRCYGSKSHFNLCKHTFSKEISNINMIQSFKSQFTESEKEWDVTQLNFQPWQLQQRCEPFFFRACSCSFSVFVQFVQQVETLFEIKSPACVLGFKTWTALPRGRNKTFPNGKWGMEVF